MKFPFRAGVAAALLALAALAQAAEPGRAEFEAGVAAYRAGDAAGALRAFQAARAAGYDSPQLRFNLGVCHYRLRQYPQARAEFTALRADPAWAGVADSHLRLVAAREDAARPPAASAYLLLGAGYDTNPALLDEGLQPAGGGESAGAEAFGAFEWPLGGDARAFTALRGGAFLRDYAQDLDQDQAGAFAGLARERRTAARRSAWGIDASTSRLDGEAFLDSVTVGALRAPAGTAGWQLSGQVSRIAAADAFAHLDGWRARAALARIRGAGGARLRLGYDIEFNDRADLRAGSEFSSHSPLRQRVELAVEHGADAGTRLRWHARYRDSRHADPDAYLDGAVLREERRIDRLAQAGVQARRRLGPRSNALLEYQFSHNTSSIPGYGYDRHTLLLGLELLPAR